MLFGMPLTARNVVCGVLFATSMLLFAIAFVLLGMAEQHMKPGYWAPRHGDPDPERMDQKGADLLTRGQRVRMIAILVFVLLFLVVWFWQ